MTTKTTWQPKLDDCPPSLLRTLVTFADEGSVSKAATALGLEQPVVSRRLKAFTGGTGTAILPSSLGSFGSMRLTMHVAMREQDL